MRERPLDRSFLEDALRLCLRAAHEANAAHDARSLRAVWSVEETVAKVAADLHVPLDPAQLRLEMFGRPLPPATQPKQVRARRSHPRQDGYLDPIGRRLALAMLEDDSLDPVAAWVHIGQRRTTQTKISALWKLAEVILKARYVREGQVDRALLSPAERALLAALPDDEQMMLARLRTTSRLVDALARRTKRIAGARTPVDEGVAMTSPAVVTHLPGSLARRPDPRASLPPLTPPQQIAYRAALLRKPVTLEPLRVASRADELHAFVVTTESAAGLLRTGWPRLELVLSAPPDTLSDGERSLRTAFERQYGEVDVLVAVLSAIERTGSRAGGWSPLDDVRRAEARALGQRRLRRLRSA